MSSARPVLSELRAIIPPLLPEFHKGQCGRVGVIGGCREYTGAPFFASMASMRLGCDMSFTMCDPVAAPTIKGYSADVIVHPIFDASRPLADVRTDLSALFSRLHSLVIGPGLGREQHMQAFAQAAIDVARSRGLYVVLDADALWLLQNNPAAIIGYERAVLTPNVVEFGRLCDAVGVDRSSTFDVAVDRLAEALSGPTVLAKGQHDRIASPSGALSCDAPGGLKRCGGQGDILSGSLGTMLAWAQRYEERLAADGQVIGLDGAVHAPVPTERLPLVAAYGASLIARTVSRLGFARHGRSMLADDLLCEIGRAYEECVFAD